MLDADQAQLVIDRGIRASDLLANESFAWIVNDQTAFHIAALVAARPGARDADAVAYHHSMQHLLTELVGSLQGYMQAGEKMQQALEQMADEDDDI